MKISAGALPALVPGDLASLRQGDPVYAVTNAGGLTWSATEGILSAIRPADEVAVAGSGFRVLQFNAPIAPGSSGGALVDWSGALIGVITSKNEAGAFAVPLIAFQTFPMRGSIEHWVPAHCFKYLRTLLLPVPARQLLMLIPIRS